MPAASVSPATAAPRSLVLPALLACYLVWGSTYLAIRWALVDFPPFFQMGTRFLAAGALLFAFGLARGRPLPNAVQWRHATVVGTLMLGGGMGLTAYAEETIGSGLVAAFIGIAPLAMALCALATGQRPTRFEMAGMGVGLVGVVLLARGASFSASPLGLAAIVGAIATWSIGSVLSTSRMPLAPGAMGFASEMLCGGAVLLVFSLTLREQPNWAPQLRSVLAWGYLVVFGSLVGFSAFMYLLSHASPAVASSYAFVNPLIALLLGVAVGGEAVSTAEWVAAAVVLAGVVLIFRGKTTREVT